MPILYRSTRFLYSYLVIRFIFLDPIRVAVVKGIDPRGYLSDLYHSEYKEIYNTFLLP